MIGRLAASIAVSAGVSLAAWKAGALTPSGAIAASAVGSIVLHRGGLPGTAALGAFFVSGSIASKFVPDPEVVEKRGSRDAGQVIANGGVSALALLVAPARQRDLARLALAGAMSAATADTWATAAGLRYGNIPRSLLSGELVPPGLSGGVTAAGALGSVAGSLSIAALSRLTGITIRDALIVANAGVLGAFIDSLVGDLLQEKRRSLEYDTIVEGNSYRGTSTVYESGVGWIDNDLVNLTCTLSGALIASGAGAIWRSG